MGILVPLIHPVHTQSSWQAKGMLCSPLRRADSARLERKKAPEKSGAFRVSNLDWLGNIWGNNCAQKSLIPTVARRGNRLKSLIFITLRNNQRVGGSSPPRFTNPKANVLWRLSPLKKSVTLHAQIRTVAGIVAGCRADTGWKLSCQTTPERSKTCPNVPGCWPYGVLLFSAWRPRGLPPVA